MLPYLQYTIDWVASKLFMQLRILKNELALIAHNQWMNFLSSRMLELFIRALLLDRSIYFLFIFMKFYLIIYVLLWSMWELILISNLITVLNCYKRGANKTSWCPNFLYKCEDITCRPWQINNMRNVLSDDSSI